MCNSLQLTIFHGVEQVNIFFYCPGYLIVHRDIATELHYHFHSLLDVDQQPSQQLSNRAKPSWAQKNCPSTPPPLGNIAISPSSTSITIPLLITRLAILRVELLVEIVEMIFHFLASLLLRLGLPLVG